MIDDDTYAIIVNAREALLAARPHVEEAQGWYESLLLAPKAQDAGEVLERIDLAILDADEVLV
jgi:hypothetical protein